MHRRTLTSFQLTTESALVAALRDVGWVLCDFRYEGENETLIRARLGASAAEIFIYEDEAQLLGPDIDAWFESPDFPDAASLCDTFIATVLDYAKGHGHG
jgi:hypothetical protein